MLVEETFIEGLFICTPRVFSDDRGHFFEAFNESIPSREWVQDNQSYSIGGVLRGLHYQKQPHGQSKLVRCLEGAIFDVVVDLRPTSPTYLQHFSAELSSHNNKMLLIGPEFAHGFLVLSECARVLYKVDKSRVPESESGLRFDDPALNIKWPHVPSRINERDAKWPLLNRK
jgi:dTDP-4-dehydrorhamnose 3,5-epimerase